jgi:hypothetical protein
MKSRQNGSTTRYSTPEVRTFTSSEILELLGPAQGFASGPMSGGGSLDPFSSAGTFKTSSSDGAGDF